MYVFYFFLNRKQAVLSLYFKLMRLVKIQSGKGDTVVDSLFDTVDVRERLHDDDDHTSIKS